VLAGPVAAGETTNIALACRPEKPESARLAGGWQWVPELRHEAVGARPAGVVRATLSRAIHGGKRG
jgi:hypothetical protein